MSVLWLALVGCGSRGEADSGPPDTDAADSDGPADTEVPVDTDADDTDGGDTDAPAPETGRLYTFWDLHVSAYTHRTLLAPAGDLDGDGYADLLGASIRSSRPEGQWTVFYGPMPADRPGLPFEQEAPDGPLLDAFVIDGAPIFVTATAVVRSDIAAPTTAIAMSGAFTCAQRVDDTLALGSAAGVWVVPATFADGEDPAAIASAVLQVEPTALVAGRLNGDAHDDVVAVSDGDIAVFYGPLAGATLPSTTWTPSRAARGAYLGDVDGDGVIEIFVHHSDSSLGVYTADGTPLGALPGPFWSAFVGDLDGDGIADLGDAQHLWYGPLLVDDTSDFEPASGEVFTQFVDLDGDGDVEPLVIYEFGQIWDQFELAAYAR